MSTNSIPPSEPGEPERGATSEICLDSSVLLHALASAGQNQRLREDLFSALRLAEKRADDPAAFRERVRWPVVLALLQYAQTHRVVLRGGLAFDVAPDSRIEKALLLSPEEHPDHVWEPQTTRLLLALAVGATHVIVGGAYIGDHALPLARAVGPGGLVHAFEPMARPLGRLVHNARLNAIDNVLAHRLALWSESDVELRLSGSLALASAGPTHAGRVADEWVTSVTIADYQRRRGLSSIGLIMLDTEGAEESALLGAQDLLRLPVGLAPNIVFEIHRHFVDWTHGLESTSIVRLLAAHGYHLFAIRDFHSNHSMDGQPIEVIPIDRVYLEGPPHGFNVVAVKDLDLLRRLSLLIVEDVSPKLIREKDPALHHPTNGLPAFR